MTQETIVLRKSRDKSGTRELTASLHENGDLVIDGCDIGSGVEEVLGFLEYEWTWTIRAANVPKLLAALAAQVPVLVALQERFSDERSAGLRSFLDEQKIPYEVWTRRGD